jgi:sugar transferase (PEP-CTERM/EpsH1 system associated)
VKLLWLNAGLLLPLDKGGKLRTWHVMRHLAARHDITYVSFSEPSEAHEHRLAMYEVCTQLETVPRSDPAKRTLRFYADAARYVLDPVPYAIAKYRSAAYRDRVETLLRSHDFDAVVCDFLVPLVNMPDRLPCPAILFTHNVESEIWRRHAETARNPVANYLLGQQWQRMLRFERHALARFDLVLAVSDADSRAFERLYPGASQQPLHVIPTGVDTNYFRPISSREPEPPTHPRLVFTGSMDWLPNEDGVLWFVRDILPLIRRTLPQTRFDIVGRSPTPAIRRLAEEQGIVVTGRVDDVRPQIAVATVYVVPLRIGGGTRLKIFEAMAMGKAVVSTTVGAEGLPVEHGVNIAIADEAEEFGREVVRLVTDHAARQQIATAARRLVMDRYDWSATAHHFEDALARVCRPDRVTGGPRSVSNPERSSFPKQANMPVAGSISR